MEITYEKFHANKRERLISFEDTVKHIFDEKLKIFGDGFAKANSSESVTHFQIFVNYRRYYFIKVVDRFDGTLQCFDKKGLPRNIEYKS